MWGKFQKGMEWGQGQKSYSILTQIRTFGIKKEGRPKMVKIKHNIINSLNFSIISFASVVLN